MLAYPVVLTPDKKDGGYVVTFPDIPEAITQGETEEEALAMAVEALESSLDFYLEAQRVVPMPSVPEPEQRTVELPLSVSAKLLLLHEMAVQQVPPAELARRMATTAGKVGRLIDLHRASKIDRIAAAMRALGKKLDVVAS